jgi:hypothetical protein
MMNSLFVESIVHAMNVVGIFIALVIFVWVAYDKAKKKDLDLVQVKNGKIINRDGGAK